MANALGLSFVILKRLFKCQHNRQHRQIRNSYSSSKPEISDQSHMMSRKVCSQYVNIYPSNSSVTATLVTSSAFFFREGSRSQWSSELLVISQPAPRQDHARKKGEPSIALNPESSVVRKCPRESTRKHSRSYCRRERRR